MKDRQLDDPNQIFRTGRTLKVDFWYPGCGDNVTHIEVGLVDVRAADSIRIHYDFDRDGYSIEQASIFEWEEDDEVCDPDWKEVSFVPAWERKREESPCTK